MTQDVECTNILMLFLQLVRGSLLFMLLKFYRLLCWNPSVLYVKKAHYAPEQMFGVLLLGMNQIESEAIHGSLLATAPC